MRVMQPESDTGLAIWDPPEPPDVLTDRDFLGVPDPVTLYFRRVLPLGELPVTALRLEQEGEMLIGDKWRPFTATHDMAAGPPRFEWDARVRMAPLLQTHVRDSFIRGVGRMHATLGGLVTVANEEGTDEMNAGALHRYLAEATWMPSALLPRYGVSWRSIDASRASATLTAGGTTVSLEFTFNNAGEAIRVFTPRRFRAVDGHYEPTPWMATFGRYESHCGMWVPTEGEVSWEIGAVWRPWWRGRNVKVEPGKL